MADWIKNLKSEDESKAKGFQEKAEINNQFSSIINAIRECATLGAVNVNRELFGNKDTVKVKDGSNSNSSDYTGFCVAIDSVPMKWDRSPDEKYHIAYLYINYNYENAYITRTLRTVYNSATNKQYARDKTLPPLQISINEGGVPFIHIKGQVLTQDEVAKNLIEPVIKAYRGGEE
jgi:hypothetical protein